MIGSDFTQPRTACCGWCGDEASGDHAPCVVALRNLGLDYCAACGGALGVHGEQHDLCMVFLTGRPDLLEPSAEDQARLVRLAGLIEAAARARECADPPPAAPSTLADRARWN